MEQEHIDHDLAALCRGGNLQARDPESGFGQDGTVQISSGDETEKGVDRYQPWLHDTPCVWRFNPF